VPQYFILSALWNTHLFVVCSVPTTGPCGDSETETPFAGFPVCNIIDSNITVTMARADDGPSVNPELFRAVAFGEVRSFADNVFNEQSEIARMSFDYPIHVKATMIITLYGVPNKMMESDQEIFLSIVKTGVLGILETNKDVVEFEFGSVAILFQVSSSGARRQMMLRSLQDANAADGYNKVHVSVYSVCGNPNTCTDEALQTVLDENGAAYGDVLALALKAPPAGDLLYFQNVQDVSVGQKSDSLPQLPPITVFVDEDEDNKDEQKFPKWLGILIFCSLLVAATLICMDVKRRKNNANGDKLDDYEQRRKRELDDDSEYSERKANFESQEVQPAMNFTTVSGAHAGGDEEDAGSIGDEFSLDGGEISLAGPDQDAQFEPDHNHNNSTNNLSTTDFGGQSFRAPRRTRNVSRGRSKRYQR